MKHKLNSEEFSNILLSYANKNRADYTTAYVIQSALIEKFGKIKSLSYDPKTKLNIIQCE